MFGGIMILQNKCDSEMLCDLHTHSNFSDGTLSPEELIEKAERTGLSAIALCDHNTISGLPRFLAAAEKSNIIAVPGVEVTSVFKGREVHILGLFLKKEYYSAVTEYLETFVKRKFEASRMLAKNLVDGGFDIDYNAILESAGGAVPNRVYFAKELIRKGYISEIPEAFEEILAENGRFYKSAERISAFEVIEFLKSVEAIPVLAHPFLSLSYEELCEFLPKAKECGLIGIETFYSYHTEENVLSAKKLAEKFGLIESGGSDFHGENRPDVKIGVGKDNIKIPMEIYEKLKNVSNSTCEKTEHQMKLHVAPFEMIKCGKKTIELRLYDEKRRKINVGDTIVFTNKNGEKLRAVVSHLHVFENFAELYSALPLLKCGYTEEDIDTAKPEDMDAYYSAEEQAKYGVVGIELSDVLEIN